jgi:hypothetical protein
MAAFCCRVVDRKTKWNGDFATQDVARIAGRRDSKKMKDMRQPRRPDFGRILVGRNAEKGYAVLITLFQLNG